MGDRGVFTKILAVAGTGLVWLPILAPLFFSAAGLAAGRRFHFDYLMPAELFLFALLGGLLLAWAARRGRSQLKPIGWGLTGAVAALISSQAIAIITGLASGEAEPLGWRWALVLGLLAGYVVALLVIGIGGLLLLRHLFRASQPPAGSIVGNENERPVR